MIITFFRSSSYNTLYEVCEQKYMLDYVLGYKTGTNEKASIGNVYHKTAECLGRKKLAIQNGLDYVDCEELGRFHLEEITLDAAARMGFEMYRAAEQPQWTEDDYDSMLKMIRKGINFNGGIYNPLNCDVISVEQQFDFKIEEDWARYEFELGDETISGQLGVRGTIDQLNHISDDTVEVCDYKTGKRESMKTGKLKDEDYFETDDFQAALYCYAVKKLFPQYKHVIFSIYYVNKGGPFTTPVEDKAEEMMREMFDRIKRIKYPKLRPPEKSGRADWFCRLVCGHHQGNCEKIRDEIKLKGIDKVTLEYSKSRAFERYMDGGGRKEKPDGA
jgi:ATP-dependent helicase/DNAse subunit B